MKKAIVVAVALGAVGSLTCQAGYTWVWSPKPTNASIKTQLANTMNKTRDSYNKNHSGEWSYKTKVKYDSSVSTANANYLGRIAFGKSRGHKTGMHESLHIYGVGTQSKWKGSNGCNTSTKKWKGSQANTQYAKWHANQKVSCDGKHFWKYGMNYEWESEYRHTQTLYKMRQDMGI